MNKEKMKKIKAAITGVIYFLQQEEGNKAKVNKNIWARSGREMIMQNRMSVQSRAFGIRWNRK